MRLRCVHESAGGRALRPKDARDGIDEQAEVRLAGESLRPDASALLELHHRLVGGSPTASAQIAEALYEWLKRRLRAAVPYASADEVADAAADSLISYVADPGDTAAGGGPRADRMIASRVAAQLAFAAER